MKKKGMAIRINSVKSSVVSVDWYLKQALLGLAVLTVVFVPAMVAAQEIQPGEACTAGEVGAYKRSSMTPPTDGGNMMYCDGSTWNSFISFASGGLLGLWNDSPEHLLDVGDEQDLRMWLSNTTNTAADPYNLGMGAATNPERRFTLSSQEGTNRQALQFGDALPTSSIFGIASSPNSGSNWYPRLRVQGDGRFIIGEDDFIVTETGLVGIGTTSPKEEFQVSAAGGHITIGGNNAPSGGPHIGFNVYTDTGDKYVADGSAFELWHSSSADQLIIGAAPSGTADSSLTFSNAMIFDTNGNIGIGQTPTAGIELDVLGDIEFTGTITDVSDRRLKDNIENLPNGQLKKITQLQGVSFTMKGDEEQKKELGLIAQDVQPHYPSLISTSPDDGIMSMNYVGIIAPMIEAIKEQQTLISEQQAVIDNLTARIEALETN